MVDTSYTPYTTLKYNTIFISKFINLPSGAINVAGTAFEMSLKFAELVLCRIEDFFFSVWPNKHIVHELSSRHIASDGRLKR